MLSVTPGIYQLNQYYSSPGYSRFLSILFLIIQSLTSIEGLDKKQKHVCFNFKNTKSLVLIVPVPTSLQ